MDIADFLQLQTALLANCIVNTTAHKEYIMGIGILSSKPLDTFFIFQDLLHLLRNGLQLRNIVTILLVCDLSSDFCKLNSQAVHSHKLCAVCLSRSNRDLRTSKCVEHLICFTGNTATNHIDDRHRSDTLFLCKPQCCQCICCFTRLADNDH